MPNTRESFPVTIPGADRLAPVEDPAQERRRNRVWQLEEQCARLRDTARGISDRLQAVIQQKVFTQQDLHAIEPYVPNMTARDLEQAQRPLHARLEDLARQEEILKTDYAQICEEVRNLDTLVNRLKEHLGLSGRGHILTIRR